MNGKAQRTQLEWPPLLNLSKDRPHVDSSFKNVERNNAPYLNSMLQPFYREKLDYKAVFDSKGNEYKIEEGILQKNNESLFEVIDSKLVRKYIEIDGLLCTDSGLEVYEDGSVYLNGVLLHSALPADYQIISARCKVLDDSTHYIVVMYYDYQDTEYVMIYDENSSGTLRADWQVDTLDVSGIPRVQSANSRNVNPCIHIGVVSGIRMVSLTAYTGEVMAGPELSYMTIVKESGSWKSVSNFLSSNGSSTITQTTNSRFSFVLLEERNVVTTTRTVVTKDYVNYYVYNATATNVNNLTKCDDIPAGFRFTQRGMYQYLYSVDNPGSSDSREEYNVLQFAEYTLNYKVIVKTTSNMLHTIPYLKVSHSNATKAPIPSGGTVFDSDSGGVYKFHTTNAQNSGVECGFQLKYFQGQDVPLITFTGAAVRLPEENRSESVTEDQLGLPITISWISSSYSGIGKVVNQYNIVLDDNRLYSLISPSGFDSSVTVYSTDCIWGICTDSVSLQNGRYVAGSPLKWISISSNFLRGVSYAIDQGYYSATWKFNNISASKSEALLTGSESASSVFTEVYYSNGIDEVRYLPGTTRKSDWNYYSYFTYNDPAIAGPSEDALTFTTGGNRVALGNGFYLLYNTYSSGYSYIQGISFSLDPDNMGTLVTPWQSIDESSYVGLTERGIVYRNKDRKWIEVRVESGAELFTVLEDRIIVVNTTSYKNAYDSEKNQWFHYASDYNGRTYHGSTSYKNTSGTVTTSAGIQAFPYVRYTANGINPLYETMPRDLFTSLLLPITARFRCFVGDEKAYGCYVSNAVQGIDIFFSDYNSTMCIYRHTIKGNSTYIKHEIQGLLYPGSTSTTASLTPNIFTKYVNGAGNNDLVVEDYDAYTLTYYDNQPYLLYSASTQVSNLYNNVSAFFVLQGQFYGVIGDKLYSLIYQSGAIANMDAIIDLGDLQFIGNNPLISFWYDPATRVIRGFTGDANMETLYSATKITEYRDSWYDETTQSLYASTDAGLLVFGPRNVFLLEEYKNTTLVQFSNDGITHITDNGVTHNLSYYEKDNYEPVPIELETSFYGLGATESTSIDRWNITLYDLEGNRPDSYIKVGVRSLTDITVKSEEKTFKITPEMYDKWSNSILISYNPKLIKGQGIRLYVETPLAIQSIVPHIMDNKTGTATRRSV